MKHFYLPNIANNILSYKPQDIDSYIQGVIQYDPPLSTKDEEEFNQIMEVIQSVRKNAFYIGDKNVQHNLNYFFEHLGVQSKFDLGHWLPIYQTIFYRHLNLLAKEGNIYFFFDYPLTSSHLPPAISLINDIHQFFFSSSPTPFRYLYNNTSFTEKNTPLFFANIVNQTFDIEQFVFSPNLSLILKSPFSLFKISQFSTIEMNTFLSLIDTSPRKSLNNLGTYFTDSFFAKHKIPHKKDFRDFIQKIEMHDYESYKMKLSDEILNSYREVSLNNLLSHQTNQPQEVKVRKKI